MPARKTPFRPDHVAFNRLPHQVCPKIGEGGEHPFPFLARCLNSNGVAFGLANAELLKIDLQQVDQIGEIARVESRMEPLQQALGVHWQIVRRNPRFVFHMRILLSGDCVPWCLAELVQPNTTVRNAPLVLFPLHFPWRFGNCPGCGGILAARAIPKAHLFFNYIQIVYNFGVPIATISLNPAVDQTVRLSRFRVDAVNRGNSIRFDAGGKGVNVASFLADYGLPVVITGFLGRENAALFEDLFQRKRIEDRCIRIPGQTRICVKIVDENARQTTDINLPGITPAPEAVDLLLQTLRQMTAACDLFVLTGSLPPGVPGDLYAQIIRMLKDQGARCLLDSSGTGLREGIRAVPDMVKPNRVELQELVGGAVSDEQTAKAAALRLIETGIQLVVVSMGRRGALFITRDGSLHAVPPDVPVLSTVGAGDALVAGLLAGQSRDLDLASCARLATAFSVSAITSPNRQLPDQAALDAFANQVQIRDI